MYKFKTEKYLELLDGKTVEWLSNKLGYSNVSLYNLFNGHRTCKYAMALAIVKVLDNKYKVEEFFDYIEGE